jgi:hypothetical protein
MQPVPIDANDIEFGEPVSQYEQHFDKDVVIPDRIARPCLVSAQLFLLLAVVSFVRGYYALGAAALILYATSINHWRKPRMTSWRHHVDLLAVVGIAVYGSYLATTRVKTATWTLVWFAGLGTIMICFVYNETTYYYQVLGEKCSSSCATWTAPGTEERERAYRRATWTHVICIHIGSGALALLLVIRGLETP